MVVAGDDVVNAAEAEANTVTITGSLSEELSGGDQVVVTVNGTALIATVNGSTFSVAVDGATLVGSGSGPVSVTAEVRDLAGNPSTQAVATYTIDTTPPAAATVVVTDDQISATESAAVAYTVSGGEGGTSVVTFAGENADGDPISVTGVNGTADLSNFADGTITVSVVTTDLAGNSTIGTGDTATVDTVAPTLATVVVTDDQINAGERSAVAYSVTGGENGATNVVTFTGENEDGEPISVTGANGTADLSDFADGPITVSVVTTDPAGNSTIGTGDTATLNTVAPAAPTLSLAPGSDSGAAGDGITNDTTPTLTGTVEEGSTVEIFNGSTSLGQATVTGSTFTFTSSVLADGTQAVFTAVATNAAANVSNQSTSLQVAIDTTAPTVAVNIVDPSLSNADRTSDVTFVFSSPVVGFTLADVTAVGGTLSVLSDPVPGTDGTVTYTATFTANPEVNTVGSVTVNAGGYTDVAENLGGSGSDTASVNTVTPVVTPPTQSPVIVGTDASEVLNGQPGVDNTVTAGFGNDTVNAYDGDDTVFGNQGNDVLFGNQGNDQLFGGQDNDSVYGGQGDDIAYGNKGDDVVYGNKGADQVFGNEGNDAVFGNEDDDLVHGGQGNDLVHGGQGNDSVFGGQGDDVLNGGLGDDFLEGGLGSDTFVFNSGQGNDVIIDFSFDEGDRLDLQGQDYVLGQNNEGQAALFLEDGGTVVLLGMTPDEFQDAFVA